MQIYSDKTSETLNSRSMVEFEGVSAGYGKLTVLKDISFSLDRGAFLYVVGPNGSGKSTLIKLLVGLLPPYSGGIKVNSNRIGFLPQFTGQNQNFPVTVKEAIYTGFKQQKLFIDKSQSELIREWLEKMEIEDLENKMMSELSGGQQQRVFLIRALISNPELLILDEPTSALDSEFRTKFFSLLQELNAQGTTIIFVTHDLHETLKHDCFIMKVDGKIKFFGTTAEYKSLYEAHNV